MRLCKHIKGGFIYASNDNCIGYLICRKQNVLAVHATQRKTLINAEHGQSIASLRQLTLKCNESTLLVLSCAERFFLAVTVASAVLPLHNTPWLKERWTLNGILIHVDDADDLRGRVYVSKIFKEPFDFQIGQHDEDHPGVRNTTLFALGIALVELCLGQILESMRNEDDPLDSNWKSQHGDRVGDSEENDVDGLSRGRK